MDIHRLRVVRFSNSNIAEKAIKPTHEIQETDKLSNRAIGDSVAEKEPKTTGFIRGSKSGTAIYKAENTARLDRKSKSDKIMIPRLSKVFQLGSVLTNLGYRKVASFNDIKKRLTQKTEQCSYFIGQTLQYFSKKKESTMYVVKNRNQCFQKNRELKILFATRNRERCSSSLTLRSESSINTLDHLSNSKTNSQNRGSKRRITCQCPKKKSSHGWFDSSDLPIKLGSCTANCSRSRNASKFLSHFNVVHFSSSKLNKDSSTRFYQVNNMDCDDHQVIETVLVTDSHSSLQKQRCNQKCINKKPKKKVKPREFKCKNPFSKRKKRGLMDPTLLMCYCSKTFQKLQNISTVSKKDEILGRKILKYILLSVIMVAWCPCIAAIGFGWLLSCQCKPQTEVKSPKPEKQCRKSVNNFESSDPCSYNKKHNKKFKKSLLSSLTGKKRESLYTPHVYTREAKNHVIKDVHKCKPYCYGRRIEDMSVHHTTNPNESYAADKALKQPVTQFNALTRNISLIPIRHDNFRMACYKTRFQNNPVEQKLLYTHSRPKLSVEHQSRALRGRPLTRDVKLVTKRSRSAIEVAGLNLKATQQSPLRSSSEPKHQCKKIINSSFQTERKQRIKHPNNKGRKNHPNISTDGFFQTDLNIDIKGDCGEYPKAISHCYVTSRNQTVPIGGYYFSDQVDENCFVTRNQNAGFGGHQIQNKSPVCNCCGNPTKCCGECSKPKSPKQRPKVERPCAEPLPKKGCIASGTQTVQIDKITQNKSTEISCGAASKSSCMKLECEEQTKKPPCRDPKVSRRRIMTKSKSSSHPKRLFLEPEEQSKCADVQDVRVRRKFQTRSTNTQECCPKYCHKGSGDDGLKYQYARGRQGSQSPRKLNKSQKPKRKWCEKKKAKKQKKKQSVKDSIFQSLRKAIKTMIQWFQTTISNFIEVLFPREDDLNNKCRDIFYNNDSCYRFCRRCPSCYNCCFPFCRALRPICDCLLMCIVPCSWCPFICCYFILCCFIRLCSSI